MLTLCAVRFSTSRSASKGDESSFQVVTPTETLELRAESAGDAVKWITVFNNAASLFKRRKLTESTQQIANAVAAPTSAPTTISQVAAIPSNNICVDCSDKGTFHPVPLTSQQLTFLCSDPQWASINLGVFMCIECSGVHRSLGTHISKVRSIDLDQWEPSVIQVLHTSLSLLFLPTTNLRIKFMHSMGNQKSNAIWEFKPEVKRLKPNPTSPRADKVNFINQKYKLRTWGDVSKMPKEELARTESVATPVPTAINNQGSKQGAFYLGGGA